ncbi:MAG TPA: hypothetical protein VJA16_24810 [Thermoanaerobaculia bacterium]
MGSKAPRSSCTSPAPAIQPVLVVLETQRVKSYLFGSRYLRETRGASLLLDRLNRVDTRTLLAQPEFRGAEVVYLGGGSGRLLFPSREPAEAFADALLALYRDRTEDARISAEVLDRLPGEAFTTWVARGVAESQSNKLGRVAALPVLGGRWLRPCTSCGRRAAETIPPPDVQGRHALCASCRHKRETIRNFYREAKRNYDLYTPIPRRRQLERRWPASVLASLAAAGAARFGEEVRLLLPVDFDDIGARSRPRNYFALIYADGNRMGETIREIGAQASGDEEAKAAYAAFSEIVDEATRTAAVAAVLAEVETEPAETRPDGGRSGRRRAEPARLIPAEFVIAGGDDLVLIVPAQAALAVAQRFVTLFQERTRELQQRWVERGALARAFAPDGLTTSAGVALSHASFPASQLLGHAAELMKLAKHLASDLAESGSPQGTIDFSVLHESGSESLKRRRATEYRGQLPSGKTVYRTERPYTAADLGALRARIAALKGSAVPRGKLKALYAALFQSPVQTQYEALRIRERLQTTGDLAAGGPLAELVAELDLFPYRERGATAWSTPLSEIVEMLDFVPVAQASGVPSGSPAAAPAGGVPASPATAAAALDRGGSFHA